MEASVRPSRKLQEHGERRAFNSSTVHIRCSRDPLDCTPQTFINCGYAGILTPNITVKMRSTRGRPRPHTAILRHPFTTPSQSPMTQLTTNFLLSSNLFCEATPVWYLGQSRCCKSWATIKIDLPLAHHHRFGCCWLPALSAIPALSLYRRRWPQ